MPLTNARTVLIHVAQASRSRTAPGASAPVLTGERLRRSMSSAGDDCWGGVFIQALHDRVHGGLALSRYDCPFRPHPTCVETTLPRRGRLVRAPALVVM